jgi:hypothetical protein
VSATLTYPDVGDDAMALEIREVIKYGDNKECHRAQQMGQI